MLLRRLLVMSLLLVFVQPGHAFLGDIFEGFAQRWPVLPKTMNKIQYGKKYTGTFNAVWNGTCKGTIEIYFYRTDQDEIIYLSKSKTAPGADCTLGGTDYVQRSNDMNKACLGQNFDMGNPPKLDVENFRRISPLAVNRKQNYAENAVAIPRCENKIVNDGTIHDLTEFRFVKDDRGKQQLNIRLEMNSDRALVPDTELLYRLKLAE